MGYGEGLQSGMNMGLGLLNFMDNRRKTALQEKRQTALDKRNELVFSQQQDDRNYDRTVLRPMREKTAKMGLSALESDIGWKGRFRERQQQNWKHQDQQRDFNNKKARWGFEHEQDVAKREKYTFARKNHELNLQKGQQALSAAMQAAQKAKESNDPEHMKTALRYAMQAQEMGIPLSGMFAGQFGKYAGMARDVSTGKRSIDDPEFQQGTRGFMDYTMKASERAGKYDFDSLEQTEDGRFAMRLKPTMSTIVDTMIGHESSGNAKAKNSRSTAEGLGQFIDKTWLSMINKHRPDLAKGRSKQQILKLKTNGDLSREMTTRYAEDNAQQLENYGYKTTPTTIYLAHHFGMGGTDKLLKSSKTASVEAVLGKDTIDANPRYRGKTVGWLVNRIAKKMNDGGDGSVPATRGMSSDKGDHVITRSQEDLIGVTQNMDKTEQAVNSGFSPEFKQTFLEHLQYAGTAQGMTAPKAKQQDRNYKYDKDLGGLYDTKTGEFKTVNGGIAGGDQGSLSKMFKDSDIMGYPEWKLNAIDKAFPDWDANKTGPILKEMIDVGDPLELQDKLKEHRVKYQGGNLVDDLINGIDREQFALQMKEEGLSDEQATELLQRSDALQEVSAKIKELKLTPEEVKEIADEALKIDGVADNPSILATTLMTQLKIKETEKQREEKKKPHKRSGKLGGRAGHLSKEEANRRNEEDRKKQEVFFAAGGAKRGWKGLKSLDKDQPSQARRGGLQGMHRQ